MFFDSLLGIDYGLDLEVKHIEEIWMEERPYASRKSSHPELANDHSIPLVESDEPVAAYRLCF